MDLSSKFSIYDTLAMLIPGGILTYVLATWLDIIPLDSEIPPVMGSLYVNNARNVSCYLQLPSGEDNEILFWIIFLVASYILGLLNNWINEGIFRGFRNNSVAIENELNKVLNDSQDLYLCKFIGRHHISGDIIWLLPMIVVISWHIIIRWLRVPFCNSRKAWSWPPMDTLTKTYYKAYFALSQHGKVGSIPEIESQVMFLRNLILPLLLFSIFY